MEDVRSADYIPAPAQVVDIECACVPQHVVDRLLLGCERGKQGSSANERWAKWLETDWEANFGAWSKYEESIIESDPALTGADDPTDSLKSSHNPALLKRFQDTIKEVLLQKLQQARVALQVAAEYGDCFKLECAMTQFVTIRAVREKRIGAEATFAKLLHQGSDDDLIRLSEKTRNKEMQQAFREIRIILQEGLNTVDEFWSTPLHKAAENDYPDCVRMLVAAGAKIAIRDKKGQTPLHVAARNGCIECVKLLMKAGSEWDKVHEKERADKEWPLYHNIIDYKGNTALHLAVMSEGDFKLLDALLVREEGDLVDTDEEAIKEHKSAMDKRNFDGFTPCVVAALNHREFAMHHLIRKYNAKYKDGQLDHDDRKSYCYTGLGILALALVAAGIYLLCYYKDNSIFNTQDHHCHYYYQDKTGAGILLEPNASLIISVFAFNLAAYSFFTFFYPCCHYVQHYIRGRHCSAPAASGSGQETRPDRPLSTSLSEKKDPKSWIEEVLFDPDKSILHSWRIQKYASLRYSHPRYGGYEFSYQAEFFFYYLQVLFSMIKFGRILHKFGTQNFADVSSLRVYAVVYGRIVNSICLNTAFSLIKLIVFGKRQSQFLYAPRIFGSWLVGIIWWFYVTFPVWILLPPLLMHVLPGVVLFPWLWACILAIYWLIGIQGHKYLYPKNNKTGEETAKSSPLAPKKKNGTAQPQKENLSRGLSSCLRRSHCCSRFSCLEDREEKEKRMTDAYFKQSVDDIFLSHKRDGERQSERQSSRLELGDTHVVVDSDDKRRSQHVVTKAELGKYHLRRLEDPRLMLLRHLYWVLLQFLARFAFLIFFQVLYDYVSLSIYDPYQDSGSANTDPRHFPATGSSTSELFQGVYVTAWNLRSQSHCYLRIMTSNYFKSKFNFLNFVQAIFGAGLEDH